jgi:hypothetical protein
MLAPENLRVAGTTSSSRFYSDLPHSAARFGFAHKMCILEMQVGRGGTDGHDQPTQGMTKKCKPSERFVVFAAGGSRNQACAKTLAPAANGVPSAPGVLET